MTDQYEPGEGPPDAAAKDKAKAILDDAAHQKPVGSPEDMATVDGALEEEPDD